MTSLWELVEIIDTVIRHKKMPQNSHNHRRVFCLGFDGGAWTVLRPLMEAGRMPNLTKLAQSGVSGVLHSTIPPITPAAWSTFMTGCNAGKHGVFDFMAYDSQTHQTHFVNATSLRVPTLWQALSQYGKRVAVVDMPVTYPPPEINGVVVSGLMTPSRQSTFTYPANLLPELEQHLGYEWPLLKEEEERGGLHEDFEGFLKLMQRFLQSRTEAMLYLFKKEPWDFSFLQWQCVDFLQHPMWKYLEESHPAFSHTRHGQVVQQFFVPLDQALGRLLAAAKKYLGEETLFVIVSDHGFQRHRKRVELNHWLHAQGFLVPAEHGRTSWMRWAEAIRRADVWHLRKRWLPKSRRNALGNKLRAQRIDHERSRFFAVSAFWGYVYLGPNATSQDVHLLETKLKAWRDPQTEQPIARKIHRREDCFAGEVLERLPQLIIEPMPGYTFATKTYFNSGNVLAPVPEEDFQTGTHAREGIFVLAGPGVESSRLWQASEAHLQDLMPTLLHWLGLPIPDYCDGSVRQEWFTPAQRERDVVYANTKIALKEEVRLNELEQRELEQRLQALGYL